MELVRLMREDTPKLNKDLANGLAFKRMKDVERYVNGVWWAASRRFPEGLKYLGGKRCTVQEEFNQVVRKRNSRRGMRRKKSGKSFDTAPSDMYLFKYNLSFNGEELDPAYLYLPIVGQAGKIRINDSLFTIAPVLADRVISISTESIFVRILSDKLTFRRLNHMVRIDDSYETLTVVWSMIHHMDGRKQGVKPTVNAKTCMMHYLLCKYGLTETFQRFANVTPVVGVDLNEADFPADKWVICRSAYVGTDRRLPTNGRRGPAPSNVGPRIMLAFEREKFTPAVRNMVAGFYYVFDHLPFLMEPAYLENRRQWMIMMGHILWSGNLNAGELADRVEDHINSLDEYIDAITQAQMADINIKLDDIYQFFAIIIEKYNQWYLEGSAKVNSMYDKAFMVLYYVMLEVSKAIIKFAFDVKAANKKGLTKEVIQKALMKNIKPGLMFRMNRMSEIVSAASYSGDNMAFKLTSSMVPQSASARTPARGGAGRGGANDESRLMHSSVAVVGSYSAMTKQDPSGRSRLNLHVRTDEDDVVQQHEDLREILDLAQEMFTQSTLT